MAISARGLALGLALITACGGTAFKAGEQEGRGRGGASGAATAGAQQVAGRAPAAEAGAASLAGASNQLVSGGEGGAIDQELGGPGEGGAAGAANPLCAMACADDEECAATPAGPECRCAGALVREGATCRLPRSCDELHRYAPSLSSGPYTLKPAGATSSFQGYCGMTQEGGGWTLVVNEGPGFDPTTEGVAGALGYASSGTSVGYSLVPLESDVMLDVSNSPIAVTTYTARLVVTGVHTMSRGKTLRTLFTTGPNYIEAENNSNLAVRMRDGADCSTLPADLVRIACLSCDSAGCKEPVMVFGDGDADASCHEGSVPHFAIGGAEDYVMPWNNCAGWPQAPGDADFSFYPAYVRVWVR
jgi:fibrinogen beta/gamma subunit family protein